ncbi:MAG TPA: aminoacetone oxidase family FAD-binding enzyme [Gemmatimonadales bacterium]|nr:aminoacetone oxidase family FAD-binding enzyme [Gemmatimonadales bacterium]
MNIASGGRGSIAVIGAGAAGAMAAIAAAERGARVTLIEGTADGGRKILISGGGRCNILPGALQEERFVTDSSPNTLRLLLRSWPLREQRAFFDQELRLGLTLEPESGKLFPASNRARDVRDGLIDLARARGVELRFGTRCQAIAPSGAGWRVEIAGGIPLEAAAVILATGGLSVPATGSDGWGLAAARRLGHAINPTYAALTPLTANPAMHADLSGVSLTATLSASGGGRSAVATGGFLFTHRGYSGPSVLDVSHVVVRAMQEGAPASLKVLWGVRDAGWWEESLKARGSGRVLTLLREELPQRLAERLLEEAGIDKEQTMAQLRREERLSLLERLTRYPLAVTGDEGYKKAEVTGGGVVLGEIDPRTMESRMAPGLFLCGEILDAFGPIGGYNFAWAWATGRAAGYGAAARALAT